MGYDNYPVVPDKFLMPDGSIVTFSGVEYAPADSARADVYRQGQWITAKWLLPDGSITSALPIASGTSGATYVLSTRKINGHDLSADITLTADDIGIPDPLVYKGVIDCAASPNYPAADSGHAYIVSVAGKIGGASGLVVAAGDMIICNADGTPSGNQATVGSYWNILEHNIDLTNITITGGSISNVTMSASDITVGSGKTLDVSAGTLTLANDQISGDKVEGGTINATTINTLTGTTANVTTFDTNVAAAGVTLSGTTLSADGSNSDISINITPKGTGSVVMPKVDVAGGEIDGTTIGANSASTGKFTSVTTDTINESTGGAGVTIDGVKLKDGGALTITGGTNTFNLTNGTASLDVAVGKAVDINDNLTVTAGKGVTLTAEDNNSTITLDNATLEVENANATQRAVKIVVGTDAAATLQVEGTAGAINQDVTTDGNPQFSTIELGHASDTTITRTGSGDIAIEGNGVYRVGGTDVAVADGGTNKSSWTQYSIPYASATTTIGEIAPAASSILVTNGSNVPSLSTDIPTAVTVGGAYNYRAGGTDIPITDGGTGASDAATAFANLKQAATTSVTGVVELATNAETATGTSTSLVLTPDDLKYRLDAATENIIEDLSYLPPVTFVWDPGSLADGAGETSAAISVPGAALGSTAVQCIAPYDLQGITLNAYVDAAGTCKARLQNETGGTINLASGTWTMQARRI